MRKTIEVKRVLDMGNHFLKYSQDDKVAERVATANFLESILHTAEAYAGFGHLDSAKINYSEWDDAWARHRAIVEICQANDIPGYAHGAPRWEDYCVDDSRRVYYVKTGL